MNTRTFLLLSGIVFILGLNVKDCYSRTFVEIQKALENEHADVRKHALEEFKAILQNENSQNTLEKYFFNPAIKQIEMKQGVRMLSHLDTTAIKRIVGIYSDCNSLYNPTNFIYIIAALGTKARCAIPFLTKKLEQYKEGSEKEGMIRVALANVGYESKENISTILADLKKHNERSDGEIKIMLFTGLQEWVNNDIISEFLERINIAEDVFDRNDTNSFKYNIRKSEDAIDAAFILVSYNKKIDSLMPQLKELSRYSEKDVSNNTITITIMLKFAIFKLDRGKNKAISDDFVRILGSRYFGNHTDYYALVNYICPALEPNMCKKIGAYLDSNDPELQGGAIRLLGVFGLYMREYTPKVLKILKESSNEELRLIAVENLRLMGDSSCVPILEDILKNETEYSIIVYSLKETINALKVRRL